MAEKEARRAEREARKEAKAEAAEAKAREKEEERRAKEEAKAQRARGVDGERQRWRETEWHTTANGEAERRTDPQPDQRLGDTGAVWRVDAWAGDGGHRSDTPTSQSKPLRRLGCGSSAVAECVQRSGGGGKFSAAAEGAGPRCERRRLTRCPAAAAAACRRARRRRRWRGRSTTRRRGSTARGSRSRACWSRLTRLLALALALLNSYISPYLGYISLISLISRARAGAQLDRLAPAGPVRVWLEGGNTARGGNTHSAFCSPSYARGVPNRLHDLPKSPHISCTHAVLRVHCTISPTSPHISPHLSCTHAVLRILRAIPYSRGP